MQEILVITLLFVMGAQFGTAVAASVVVHPILGIVQKNTAIEFFSPFFHRTHKTVISKSIIVTVLAAGISIISGNWWWLGITIIMHLNAPYTYFVLMPVNRRLLANDVDPESEQTQKDLINWGKIHAFRTLLNGITFLLFIFLAVWS